MSGKKHRKKQDNNQLSGFLAGFLFLGGLLLGSVAGAGAMLFMAPQSGKKTRKQLKHRGRKVRKQITKMVKHKVEEVHDQVNHATSSIHVQVEDLQQSGQDMVDAQKDRWEPVIKAGKTAVQS
jgi:gas vesicle protein